MTAAFNRSAIITNALIRCMRDDIAASPVFELVREDLGLWVLELDFNFCEVWASQFESISDHIERHRVLLTSLAEGSSDFSLHITAEADETLPLRIPVRLSRLASECGFEIEIYTDTKQAEQADTGNRHSASA
jgi:hypothetical protein